MDRRKALQNLSLSAAGLMLSLTGGTTPNFRDGGMQKEDIIRLLYNENPNGPSDIVVKAIKESIYRANRYCTFHEPDLNVLKDRIAAKEGLSRENVLVGHGSFQPLMWLAVQYGINGGEIIVPDPTFDVVGGIGKRIGATIRKVALTPSGYMDLESMQKRITNDTKLVTICNPNNPTGTFIEATELADFCLSISENCPVLIDEAYIHYLNDWRQYSMHNLIIQGQDVLISRTFSKIYGMAGLRIGYLLGPKHIIGTLEENYTLGFPGNMPNVISVAAAIAALDDDKFLMDSRHICSHLRTKLCEELRSLGLPYFDSVTNFLYFDVRDFQAFRSFMRSNNIILAGGWPALPNWARVTITTSEELSHFIALVKTKKWLK